MGLRACREITESLPRTHLLPDVMVGGGRPTTARGADPRKFVHNRHSPAMTALGDGAPTAALVLAPALSRRLAVGSSRRLRGGILAILAQQRQSPIGSPSQKQTGSRRAHLTHSRRADQGQTVWWSRTDESINKVNN
jgi:hypothetical protein